MLTFTRAQEILSKEGAGWRQVYVVCSGQIAHVGPGVDGIVKGWLDMPLSKFGFDQAAAAAKELAGAGIQAIVCSDLARAQDTAQVIGKVLGVEPMSSDKLRTWDLGELTGMPATASSAAIERYVKAGDVLVPDGESFDQFRERTFAGIAEACSKNAGKVLALVVHHQTRQLLDAWALSGQLEDHSVDADDFNKRGDVEMVSLWLINEAALAPAALATASAAVGHQVEKHEGPMDAESQATRDAVAAYLREHAPEVAAVFEKQQPGAGDVHATTAIAGKPKAKSFLTTIAELKDGARVVQPQDVTAKGDLQDQATAVRRAQLHEQGRRGEPRARGAGTRIGETHDLDVEVGTTSRADKRAGDPIAQIEQMLGVKIDGTGAVVAKQDPLPVLKPRDDGMAHSPFPYDAGALANLRPDQVPRLLGALTDQDRQDMKSVKLNTLVAMQDRVDPDKVESMRDALPDKPPLVVRFNGRNVIADGHHRLAAHYLNGDKAVDVRFKDLTPMDQAVKRAPQASGQTADTEEADWSMPFEIIKTDEDEQLVFGWASISSVNGELVIDKQDDIIPEHELERAAYEYVLYCRQQGDMHERMGVGRLVESMVFTKQKQQVLGIDLGLSGWFVGFKVDDAGVWKRIKSGDLPEFSIGGKAVRASS